MVFSFFRRKSDTDKRISHLHNSLNDSFSKIKEDMQDIGGWITHLNETKENHHEKLSVIDTRLRVVEEFMNNLLEQTSVDDVSKQLSKQEQTAVRLNQTNSLSKQPFKQLSKQANSDQTELEDALFSLTPMERTVVWSLLNTDLVLSYEDLARILGKDSSTVRGQLNNIKRKVPGLLLEKSESNGMKRFYVEDDIKRDILVKYTKKRAKISKSES